MSDALFEVEPTDRGAEFRVTYDGPEYHGEMSARELAVVLEGMAGFAEAVAQATPDQKSKVRVKVQATREGSFDIAAIVETLTGPGIGAGLAYAFQFFWNHMRKRVKTATYLREHDVWEVVFLSGELVHLTPAEWALWSSKRARKMLGRIAEPLRRGATSMTLQATGGPPLRVLAADVDRLSNPAEAEPRQRRYETSAWPDTVAFDPAKTWRMITRDGPLSGIIEDRTFLQEVAGGQVRVGVNDLFQLAIRREWVETDEGNEAKVKYFIEKVIEHRPGAEQDELPARAGQAAD